MKKTLIIALASLTLAACQLMFDKPTGDYFPPKLKLADTPWP